ncbi:hypothetical protein BASA_1317 [Bifidobacterium animalis subsp. animalis]|nr:hypothetical protein BASA_1317 [Bifidobacterium animalis subsp. animalis]
MDNYVDNLFSLLTKPCALIFRPFHIQMFIVPRSRDSCRSHAHSKKRGRFPDHVPFCYTHAPPAMRARPPGRVSR